MAKINFKYKYNPDYNPTYINGAYGGITDKGEIIANFYLQRHGLPKKEKLIIDDKNGTKTIENEPKDLNESLIRFVESGVVMNLQTAKEIVKWLNDKIIMIEQLNEKPKVEKKNDKKRTSSKK